MMHIIILIDDIVIAYDNNIIDRAKKLGFSIYIEDRLYARRHPLEECYTPEPYDVEYRRQHQAGSDIPYFPAHGLQAFLDIADEDEILRRKVLRFQDYVLKRKLDSTVFTIEYRCY